MKQHEQGSYSTHTSKQSFDEDPYEGYLAITAENDSFFVGQSLPLTQLFRTETDGPVTRIDKTVQVSGIVKELPRFLEGTWSSTAIITTERGLEAMGLRMEGLREISIYTDDDLTLEQEEKLERQLTAISRRTEGYTVENQAESYRKGRAEDLRQLLVFLCIITVFFSVAVGMIVSSVTRQLHSEGRTIGMLRAVGADEKAILGCYSGQLNAAISGGLGICAAVYAVFLVLYAIDLAKNPWFKLNLTVILQWTGVIGIILAVTAACWALSRFFLSLRIREILKKSIIDNIREL